jgi:peptide/nickel transport system substrate-binding protein
VDQPTEFLLPAGLPGPQARPGQGQGAPEGGWRHRPAHARLHGAQRCGNEGRRRSDPVDAGFDLKIRVTEFATSLKQGEDGDYQLYLIGWSGRSDPDGNSYSFQTCGSPQNNAKYCDKDVDAAHAEARAKSDPADRKKAYEKVAARFLPEGSILYIYHRRVLVALTDKVEGYKQIPDGLVRVVGVKLK